MNRKRLVIGGGILVLLLLFLLSLFNSQQSNSTVNVNVIVAPSDATLYVDDVETEPGRVSLAKGNHKLRATREFFGDAAREINTEDIKTGEDIYLALDPNTPEADAYLDDNPDEANLLQQAAGRDFSNTQETLLNKYPFISNLPYTAVDYSINYEVNNNDTIILIVTLNLPAATPPGSREYNEEKERQKNAAKQYLVESSVPVDDLQIKYEVLKP